jgi:hypothetical protein
MQFSTQIKNERLDSIERIIGTSAILRLWTGSMPSDTSQPNTGTLLAAFGLPSDWMNNASSGTKTKNGTWSTQAVATGTFGYFRIYSSDGLTCHAQGTSSELSLSNPNITNGQGITITIFTLTDGN